MTPKLFALIITLVEVILHMWAHRKNAAAAANGDGHRPDVYYRSPMHVVTRNFCEVCRHERLMGRVGKLQDVRLKQMQNYFRKVTRNIA
uniref:Putative secreted protein n=2 Tax=Anopheles marajoara TaxID=58244 RepID=A0A2M4CAC6_9DIPT